MFMKETLDLTGHGSIIIDQYQTKIHFVDDNLSSMTLSSHSKDCYIFKIIYMTSFKVEHFLFPFFSSAPIHTLARKMLL